MGTRLDANSTAIRKRIEKHKFENEEGEEYEPSKFGGFNDYFRRKKIKLQNLDADLRTSTSTNPPIFRGVVAHVNGYTQPSLNDLHTLIVSYGGGFMQYLDGKTTVTHIIASNLTPKKKVEFSRYRIVKPAWIVDSIEAERLLPWDAYRVVDEGPGQRVLGFDHGNIISQANNNQTGYKQQTDRSWYTTQVEGVADQLNSHDPDRPFPSTRLLAVDHVESSREHESSKEGIIVRLGGDKAYGPSNRDFSSVQKYENYQNALQTKYREESFKRENLDLDVDLEMLPAVDESLTESFTDTQDRSDQQSPERMTQYVAEHSSDLPLVEVAQDTIQPSFPNNMHESEIPDGKVHNAFPAFDPKSAGNDAKVGEVAIAGIKIADMTAEDHNALLLADPKVWKSTVVNPDFLKQYYEESRLHHLSAWKAALKTQLQVLAAEKSASQKLREKRVPGVRRYILHVDFDSFFAAVSLKKAPEYIEKPVVVAHGNGSGAEIASCNYPARKFGIKNGMWMKHAQKMCPDLKVLPYDFKAYEEASREFYKAIIETGGIVQSVSVDEALVDVSTQCIADGGHGGKGIQEGSIWREQAKADTIAQELRDQIKDRTGCAVSVGIGGNILLAKVALRKAKPAGQHHIKPEDAIDFIGELTMQELPGIAWSIGGKLEGIGVKFVKDVRQLSKERMISLLGPKTGEKIWDYSRGIDRSEVGDQVVRKSVSAEVNWGIRFVTLEQVDEFIQSLCDELHKRLLNEGVKGRQLTMKIMRRAADAPLDPPKHLGHGKCDIYNKSLILGVATNDASVLGREALSILKGFGFSPGELRGLGVQMQKLEAIKVNLETPFDGSQKRLQFKATTPRKSTRVLDGIGTDDLDSPKKPKSTPPPHPAATLAQTESPSGKKYLPLNLLGTQFVLPSQVDPEVLEELPSDIRSRLLAQPFPKSADQKFAATSPSRSRSTTPEIRPDIVPTHSQLDKNTLEALPDDVRSEILAHYARSPHKTHNQAVLPQSPRKVRSIKLPKKLTTPTKKRGRPVGSGGSKVSASTYSTLTQSNFVANACASTSKNTAAISADATTADDIPPDFLSALPEDIRREVLEQARRDRLQKRGGLNLTAKKRRAPPNAAPVGQRTLVLPSRPQKPTFTAQKFTQLPELRKAITAWFHEFEDEGPYQEDVDALSKYLQRVVIDERDMDKAVAVGKWLRWVIDEGDGLVGESWSKAISTVEDGLQQAIEKRGLGKVQI